MAKIDPKKQYRATEALYVGRARAANAGDIIEGTTVLNNEKAWADKVELVKGDDADAPAAAAAAAPSSPASSQS